MKKFSFFLSCAASAMFAIALTSCEAVQDNPSTGFDPSLKDITIQSGDTLAPIYKQLAATTKDIIIEIPAGVDTVYTGKIELTPGQTFISSITFSHHQQMIGEIAAVKDNILDGECVAELHRICRHNYWRIVFVTNKGEFLTGGQFYLTSVDGVNACRNLNDNVFCSSS